MRKLNISKMESLKMWICVTQFSPTTLSIGSWDPYKLMVNPNLLMFMYLKIQIKVVSFIDLFVTNFQIAEPKI